MCEMRDRGMRERERETETETERQRQRQTDRQRQRQSETHRQTERRIRMIDLFRPYPLMKGCRWMTCHFN